MKRAAAPVDDVMYDAIVEQMKSAPELYKPTQFWAQAGCKIGDALKGGGVKRFRSIEGPRQFFVPTYHLEGLKFFGEDAASVLATDLLKKRGQGTELTKKEQHLLKYLEEGLYLAQGDYRTYMAGDAAVAESRPVLKNCFESDIGDPLNQVTFGNRTFSRSMLNYMNGLVFLKTHVDTSACNKYLEIGGGFGTLGEILHRDTAHRYLYVNVDIPPASFAATWYLDQVYGGPEGGFQSCLAFPSDGTSFTIDEQQCRAASLNSWQLPGLQGPFDVFVNFISFQEMEPEIVKNYVSHVARLGCKYALLRNLREGKKKVETKKETKWGQQESTAESVTGQVVDDTFFANGFKLVAKSVWPFGFETVDGFHSELSLYARK